jgi:hypothetical protein
MQISIAAKPAQSEKDDKKIEKNVIDRPKKLIKFSQVVVKKNISLVGQCSFIFFVPVFTDNCNIDFVRVFKKIVGVEAESFVIEPVAAHFNVDIHYIQRGFGAVNSYPSILGAAPTSSSTNGIFLTAPSAVRINSTVSSSNIPVT